ncbi:hypothetical protein L6164_016125 [Bauhinia variegata]|uniref:Uncharacterized protein n=1 Tax=Bauhinia variegata TaxID=167791 RepID=A0ACB9NMZ0_BAUVA|nr:hypothetical protein L6164_016125 [Bauhinia variegata]
MGLSSAQPGLSLGLSAQIPSPALVSPVSDNLYSLHVNSSFHSSSSPIPSAPLHLLEENDEKVRAKNGEEQMDDETISFMGRLYA